MTKTTSARDIEVPGPFDRGKVPFEDMSLLERMQALKAAFGPKPNKNELAAALIVACIEGGVRHQRGIVDMVSRCGLDIRHVGAILTNERKSRLHAPRWTRDADGKYRVLGC